jgi:serine/threonine protein kinase
MRCDHAPNLTRGSRAAQVALRGRGFPGSDSAPVRSPVGTRWAFRYSLRHLIGEHGRGGLGRVSRAHDRELGRDVAIKELISRGHLSEIRCLREALITARLEHPGIVPVHEAGRWPHGTLFYAMKRVAGRSLRELIAQRRTVDDRIALLHHVIAVADAIADAHGRNIIHRDLKPANVIVGDFGETIVIDWGLAKDLTSSEESAAGHGPGHVDRGSDLTSTGSILGTPAYMAPEQERGEHVDQRADVFAIGAMLWELCALQRIGRGRWLARDLRSERGPRGRAGWLLCTG